MISKQFLKETEIDYLLAIIGLHYLNKCPIFTSGYSGKHLGRNDQLYLYRSSILAIMT